MTARELARTAFGAVALVGILAAPGWVLFLVALAHERWEWRR